MAYIFLSVPILDRPEFKMIHSMYQAILSCKEHKVRLFVNENDSLISRVRNVHISMFLNEYKDCDYFMSLDSDIEVVNCFSTNNIFSKLIAHDKDFVGGLYALKQFDGPPSCSSIPLDGTDRAAIPFDQGLIPMRWLSAGCWCIKRSAVEKMVEHYPELTYVGDDNVTGKPIHGLYNPDIFDIENANTKQTFRKYLSEDWSWCERWRNIGGEIYADTGIVLRHLGKIPYSLWNVEVVARKVNDDPPPEAKQLSPKEQEHKEVSTQKPLSDLPKPFKVEAQPTPQISSLPVPGWDLKGMENRTKAKIEDILDINES